MDKSRIIRAWKDPEYRASLSNEERGALPECPAGKPLPEIDEGDLCHIIGGSAVTAYANCHPSVVFKRCPTEDDLPC